MRHGETSEFVKVFRDRYLKSGKLSADWNQTWLDFVRAVQQERDIKPNEKSKNSVLRK
jgi:hypothetical protein